MPSNKVLFLVFGVLALVFAVSMSAEVAERDSDVISDRRYRWPSSEQGSDEEDDHEDDDDVQDGDDQDDSDEFEEIEIWELAPESGESSESVEGSEESGSHEA
ncbi:anaphase-promoting complex subunit 15B [Drosophila kikkawai]|uniref:Anaphase-promoting complex subunit 15B n=1 Tax=Drosophila kikkawai TaxID=30033 RepID=A0A6P4IZS7_DROKI|nr:anaphase-promoting complex subunit 15 [Drosophila kikkawai]